MTYEQQWREKYDQIKADAVAEYAGHYKLMLKIQISYAEYASKSDWLKNYDAHSFRVAGMEILLGAMSFTETDIANIQENATAEFWREFGAEESPK
jgi:hypothetical protein